MIREEASITMLDLNIDVSLCDKIADSVWSQWSSSFPYSLRVFATEIKLAMRYNEI